MAGASSGKSAAPRVQAVQAVQATAPPTGRPREGHARPALKVPQDQLGAGSASPEKSVCGDWPKRSGLGRRGTERDTTNAKKSMER